MTLRLHTGDSGFESSFRAFLNVKRGSVSDIDLLVADIISDVREHGDAALIDFTRKFDRFDLNASMLRVSPDEIRGATDKCEPEILSALKLAYDRILDFHKKQIPKNLDFTDTTGIRLGYRWMAIEAAGLYVPGGTAAYPSSVLMNGIPAKVAGVRRLVMTIPAPDNEMNPLVLAAANMVGIDEVYRIGGAQAIAALAFGTQTVSPVDKIYGPGNAYVAEAKRQVFGKVGIDMIAGPSEILILADADNDPKWLAIDLLSQAEHDASAQSILITDSSKLADKVVNAIEDQLKLLPRSQIARESWESYGAVFIVKNLTEGLSLVDRIAPEHLEISTANARELAEKVNAAGAIFIGQYGPEAIGDYIAGPNHVLPTLRSARFSSGLSVLDFMKRTSMIECSRDGLVEIGPSTIKLARAEGLEAHALSVSVRLKPLADD
ncbi:MAG: histidinol dehydrogenase [Magnetovibrio sp.]|nr:histidinol dehydrogenase [Magnetovibrio sp.]